MFRFFYMYSHPLSSCVLFLQWNIEFVCKNP